MKDIKLTANNTFHIPEIANRKEGERIVTYKKGQLSDTWTLMTKCAETGPLEEKLRIISTEFRYLSKDKVRFDKTNKKYLDGYDHEYSNEEGKAKNALVKATAIKKLKQLNVGEDNSNILLNNLVSKNDYDWSELDEQTLKKEKDQKLKLFNQTFTPLKTIPTVANLVPKQPVQEIDVRTLIKERSAQRLLDEQKRYDELVGRGGITQLKRPI